MVDWQPLTAACLQDTTCLSAGKACDNNDNADSNNNNNKIVIIIIIMIIFPSYTCVLGVFSTFAGPPSLPCLLISPPTLGCTAS